MDRGNKTCSVEAENGSKMSHFNPARDRYGGGRGIDCGTKGEINGSKRDRERQIGGGSTNGRGEMD